MTSYAGNPSLSREVQQRVLDTFDQTLNLAAEGSRQEALLGCDFVLRMDAQFEPARRLQERLRASAGAIVDLDDLRPSAPAIAAPADLFASLDGLGLELPDLSPDSFAPDLRAEIAALIEQRRFQELMAMAPQHGPAIAGDPELQRMLQQAQERIEAEPYVNKFLTQARAALQAGQTDEVARLVEKARALDASHPALAELEAAARAHRPPQDDFGATPADAAGFDLSFDSPTLDPLGSFEMPMETTLPGFSLGGDDLPGGGSGDSDPRIRQLLDEGQRAFDAGDPQGAIDAWSRIFLIDIDHAEAGRRIDQARKLKAEAERQVEEIFHDGVARLEAGDLEAAKQAFRHVLELQPGYATAREYLQQIEAGHTPTVRAAPAPHPSQIASGEALQPLDDLGGLDDLKEEILVPPDPGEMGAAAGDRRGAPAKTKGGAARGGSPRQLFLAVGSIVLLLALGGGWYVFQNRDQFFPNSQVDPGTSGAPAADPDPIARAQALHQSGKTASAISQLRRLPPTDPHHQQAQALIAQWEATLAPPPGAQPAVVPTGPAAPAIPAPQAALLAEARQALAEGSHLRAVEYFEEAAKIGKLGAEETALLTDARKQLEPLAKQIDLFRQREWDFILNDLWKMHQADPGNRDVSHLIVSSYYNLGIRDLQRSDPQKAADKFKEALNLAPGDELLRRHYMFAQTYQERPKDLLYRIYVKYLALR
jgi:tetratricopeptide (TPR) repeat protein